MAPPIERCDDCGALLQTQSGSRPSCPECGSPKVRHTTSSPPPWVAALVAAGALALLALDLFLCSGCLGR